MADGLSPKQSQQQEALKVLTDWSKWLVALETTAIGGAFLAISFLLKSPCPHPCTVALLAVSAALFALSIWGIVYLFYGMPDIVEQLPDTHVSSINEMKSKYLNYGLLRIQKLIYWTSTFALVFLVGAMLSFPVCMLSRCCMRTAPLCPMHGTPEP